MKQKLSGRPSLDKLANRVCFQPSVTLMAVSLDRHGRRAGGNVIVGDVARHDAVGSDNAVPPDPATDNAHILTNPRAVADVNFGHLPQTLLKHRPGNVLVLMQIVRDEEPIGYQHVLPDLDQARADDVRMISDPGSRPILSEGSSA